MKKQLALQLDDGVSIPTSPLQFKVEKMSAINASKLNMKWHSRLPIIDPSNITRNTHYVCFGAYYNSVCFACAIWSSPVAQNRFTYGKNILELRRLAISDVCPKNTASRFIKVMVLIIKKEMKTINRLISYQDIDVHKGTIYKASGWKPTNETKLMDWSNTTRKRTKLQSNAAKIRWELIL